MSFSISPLVKADKICDYVPVVSTLTNLTALFLKTVVIPLRTETSMGNRYFEHLRYFGHLKHKPVLQCVLFAIPVIGNIVGVYKYIRTQIRQHKYNKLMREDAIADQKRKEERVLQSEALGEWIRSYDCRGLNSVFGIYPDQALRMWREQCFGGGQQKSREPHPAVKILIIPMVDQYLKHVQRDELLEDDMLIEWIDRRLSDNRFIIR